MKLMLCCFLLCLHFCVTAQNPQRGKISFKIFNEQKKAAAGATAELLKVRDSSLAKTAIADADGLVEFENIPFGTYFIRSSFVNHTKSFSGPVSISAESPSATVADIFLAAAPKQLNAVEVTARKPFIQKLTDRIVVNV